MKIKTRNFRSFTDSGFPIHGNATVTLKVTPPQTPENVVTLTQDISEFRGVSAAVFPMDEIRRSCGCHELAGSQLEVRPSMN